MTHASQTLNAQRSMSVVCRVCLTCVIREKMYMCISLREEENHYQIYQRIKGEEERERGTERAECIYIFVHHCERKRIILSPCLSFALSLSFSMDYSKSEREYMCMYTSLRDEENHTLSMPLSFSIDYVKSDRENIYTCKSLREEENHSLFLYRLF